MGTQYVTACITALLVLADAGGPEMTRGDLPELRGGWVVESFELNGRRLGSGKFARCTWTFAGKTLTCTSEGRTVTGTIEIDDTKAPKSLDIIWSHTAGRTLCIYELRKNVLRIGHFAPDRYYMPSKDRPVRFESDGSTGQDLYATVLTRLRP
jgi:uncharacterized protein (TIGR03067 family)